MRTLYFRKPFIIFSSRKVKVVDDRQQVQYYCGKYYDSRKEALRLERIENVRLFDRQNNVLGDAKQVEQVEQARDQWRIAYGEGKRDAARMKNTSTINTHMRLTINYDGQEAVFKHDVGGKTIILEHQGETLARMRIKGLSLTYHEVSYDPAMLNMSEALLITAFYTFTLKQVRP